MIYLCGILPYTMTLTWNKVSSGFHLMCCLKAKQRAEEVGGWNHRVFWGNWVKAELVPILVYWILQLFQYILGIRLRPHKSFHHCSFLLRLLFESSSTRLRLMVSSLWASLPPCYHSLYEILKMARHWKLYNDCETYQYISQYSLSWHHLSFLSQLHK